MDYKLLLTKYMAHVVDCESIDYVDMIVSVEAQQEYKYSQFTVAFTAEEISELQRMSNATYQDELRKLS